MVHTASNASTHLPGAPLALASDVQASSGTVLTIQLFAGVAIKRKVGKLQNQSGGVVL